MTCLDPTEILNLWYEFQESFKSSYNVGRERKSCISNFDAFLPNNGGNWDFSGKGLEIKGAIISRIIMKFFYIIYDIGFLVFVEKV